MIASQLNAGRLLSQIGEMEKKTEMMLAIGGMYRRSGYARNSPGTRVIGTKTLMPDTRTNSKHSQTKTLHCIGCICN